MPKSVRDRVGQYCDDWATLGVTAWDTWLPLVTRIGDHIASLINVGRGEVIMQPNVSTAEWLLISCLDFSGKRNGVVFSDLEFPTVAYAWRAQTARGARIEMVPSADGVTVDTQSIVDAIDETTLAVPISHVIFRSGYITDVTPIVERAHRVGALVFLDVYQSIGTVPIDAQALDVDAVVGGSLKWLCGGPGAAYLYVRPDLHRKLVPTLAGWLSHARPFDFSMDPMEFAPTVWRYCGGTPSPVALYAAQSGLEIVSEIGVEQIRARSEELTERVVANAAELGLRINSPLDVHRRGGHVTIDFPGAAAATTELLRRGVFVDYRPKAGIRVAPHFYNTIEEIDAAFAEIRDIVHGG